MHAVSESFSAAPGQALGLSSAQSPLFGTEPGKASSWQVSGSPKPSPSRSAQWRPPPIVAEPMVGIVSVAELLDSVTVTVSVADAVSVMASVADSDSVAEAATQLALFS